MKKLLDSGITMHKGRPTITIDGEHFAPVIYSLTDCPGGRLSYEETPADAIRRFAERGFKLFQLDIWLDDMWFPDGGFDITIARKQIRGVTDICSDAKVFFRFHTTPPKWWNHENPDQLTGFADTKAGPEKDIPGVQRYLIQDLRPVYRHSFASEKWLEDSTRMLRLFLEELSATPEAASLAGIQPATGVYGEHHYWAFNSHEPDTGECMQKAFSEYLIKKYLDDRALQKAWGRKDVKIETACVPDMDQRLNNRDGIFRDPLLERNMSDYYDCQHSLVSESIVHFCRTVKKNWPAPIITGAFYGYYISLFGRSAAGGHLDEQTILKSEYVDCMCGPQAYDGQLRSLGGAGASRGLLESAFLHGKLWIDEMDQPEHTGTIMGGMPVFEKYESKQVLRRNTMFPLIKGGGLWYYDFGPYNTTGWWADRDYADEIASLKNLTEKYMEAEYANPSDVLLVFDTQVFKHTALNSQKDPITDAACINIAYPAALKSGASVDAIYLSDIEIADLSRYKCVVLMNTFLLTKKQRDYIKKKAYGGDSHIIWFYAPGYLDGDSSDISLVSDITGFELYRETYGGAPSINYANLTYGFHGLYEKMYKTPSEFPETDIFIPKGRKSPALVSRKAENHTVWFSSLPFTTPEIFAKIFKKAGVHLYTGPGDSLISGMGLISIHTKEGGGRTVTLTNGKNVNIDLTPAETVLLDSATGEILKRG